MYWIPKFHKNPVGSRFIIASRNCSTKPLSKAMSNVFKPIYSQIENFYHKSKLQKILSIYKKFWVLQNVNPVIKNINIINITVHGIGPKLVSNWEQNMLDAKSQQILCKKKISMLPDLKVSSLACKCVYFIDQSIMQRAPWN